MCIRYHHLNHSALTPDVSIIYFLFFLNNKWRGSCGQRSISLISQSPVFLAISALKKCLVTECWNTLSIWGPDYLETKCGPEEEGFLSTKTLLIYQRSWRSFILSRSLLQANKIIHRFICLRRTFILQLSGSQTFGSQDPFTLFTKQLVGQKVPWCFPSTILWNVTQTNLLTNPLLVAPQRPLSVVISVGYLLLGIKIEKVEKFHLKMTKITINPLQFRKRSFVLKNVSKTEKKKKKHDFTFVHISSIMFKNGA